MSSAAEAAPPERIGTNRRDPASFRDRQGFVFGRRGRIYRALDAQGVEDWRLLRAGNSFATLTRTGALIGAEEVGSGEDMQLSPEWRLVLEHPVVPAISYPYEWTFGMLKDAALLQLEVLDQLLRDRLILKDGTPYNVQWMGGRPVFIDIGSITQLHRTRLWEGYRQFCRLQLFPLMLQAILNVDFRPFLRGRADGPTAAEAAAMLGWSRLARRGVLTHVHLHARLEGGTGAGAPAYVANNPELARALVTRNVAGLRRIVEGLAPARKASAWTDYGDRAHYTSADLQAKERFVAECLSHQRWNTAWDIGCNDGRFSRLAAAHCNLVLAIDADPPTVDAFYRQLCVDGAPNILPLCLDLADASPGQGWRGRERPRLEERAPPDLVLSLALIHHLVIGANLPMDDVADWFHQLGAPLIIEWVDRSDPMVKRMLGQRRDVFSDYTREAFDAALARRFKIERRLDLRGGTRSLVFAIPGGTAR